MGKHFILGIVAAIGILAQCVAAQELTFFRIGTGNTAGTYYPIGGLIANAISSPPGARPCGDGGPCGVPGLVATALASSGSVGNINAIEAGQIEAGFTQSDVAYWAQTGTGLWEGQPAVEKLRLIANLYPESIHLVARADAGIESVADLRGKRVSLDEPDSGTLVDARIILEGYGLSESDVRAEFLRPDQAATRMREGQMDAFFFVGGYPAGAIAELASQHDIKLIPIDGEAADKLRETYSFFAANSFPAGTYSGQDKTVATLSVGAQLVTSADQPEELIYAITKALYSDSARRLFAAGHVKGGSITLENATKGAGIPLHPGAEKFYREAGMIE
ncbi:MAG TPA: TAXI family TRAP transporter solute-binding subunit [Paracoccus sp. (in: a-proteobacteria)]|uniref:TAXI family TRAP transporter solute-binding subunit n=1 Tax=Paracoccus sp. TaxID=267 RepID=UPI002C4FA2AD|nr:TAXI family TRAP transporter solute-binding subunit [Paracoccus sp. (in: a-proteobacteria)]HWL58423.1 TAXI family TRAP transporter solute-binding subunit [Paracoccus sp. (in: a-proteobacteria)]